MIVGLFHGALLRARARAQRVAAAYDSALLSRPIVTRTATAVVLATSADVAAQALVPPRSARAAADSPAAGARAAAPATAARASPAPAGWDAGRTARLALFSGVMAPPVSSWYGLLAARVRSPLLRTLADQALWAPGGTWAFLFAMRAMREPRRLGDAVAAATSVTPTLLLVNYAVWVPVQLFNFSLVPPRYNMLFVNLISFGWTLYLSAAYGAASEEEG